MFYACFLVDSVDLYGFNKLQFMRALIKKRFCCIISTYDPRTIFTYFSMNSFDNISG